MTFSFIFQPRCSKLSFLLQCLFGPTAVRRRGRELKHNWAPVWTTLTSGWRYVRTWEFDKSYLCAGERSRSEASLGSKRPIWEGLVRMLTNVWCMGWGAGADWVMKMLINGLCNDRKEGVGAVNEDVGNRRRLGPTLGGRGAGARRAREVVDVQWRYPMRGWRKDG